MKRLGVLVIVLMLGLVLGCGKQEEKKAPPKPATPPAATEKAPLGATPAPAPATPALTCPSAARWGRLRPCILPRENSLLSDPHRGAGLKK